MEANVSLPDIAAGGESDNLPREILDNLATHQEFMKEALNVAERALREGRRRWAVSWSMKARLWLPE